MKTSEIWLQFHCYAFPSVSLKISQHFWKTFQWKFYPMKNDTNAFQIKTNHYQSIWLYRTSVLFCNNILLVFLIYHKNVTIDKLHKSFWIVSYDRSTYPFIIMLIMLIIKLIITNNHINAFIISLLPDYCPACRTTLVATRFRVAVICPIIQVPHCIRIFFYFVWFVFINHIFQFYYELCTYCNILDIYLS